MGEIEKDSMREMRGKRRISWKEIRDEKEGCRGGGVKRGRVAGATRQAASASATRCSSRLVESKQIFDGKT